VVEVFVTPMFRNSLKRATGEKKYSHVRQESKYTIDSRYNSKEKQNRKMYFGP